jgi:hypothetical protein
MVVIRVEPERRCGDRPSGLDQLRAVECGARAAAEFGHPAAGEVDDTGDLVRMVRRVDHREKAATRPAHENDACRIHPRLCRHVTNDGVQIL